MGCGLKAVDALLFVFFLLITVGGPLIDFQAIVPIEYYPKALVELKDWYSSECGDYLIIEKPSFFVGIVWLELCVLWPLSIVNLFAIVARKSWFNTTCLIYGVSMTTALVAIISEMVGSGKMTDKAKMTYYPFAGLAVLSVLRGLVCSSSCDASTNGAKKPVSAVRKKRV